MKRIGEVLNHISIPVGPAARNGNGAAKQEPTYRCAICKDAGWVRMEAPVGHPSFGKLYQCHCKADEIAERQLEQVRRLSNLETFANQLSFDQFKDVPGTEEAFEAAREFARNPDGWLFLHGKVGVGKTHLAVAAALEIRERSGSVLFTVVPDLLDHLRATFDPSQGVAYDERFNAIRGAFLLVLDDLGTENTTPWAREKLFQIFNHRYVERLPTIITSNQDHKKLDERILSRLLDTHFTKDFLIDAEDYRRSGRKDYTRGRRPR